MSQAGSIKDGQNRTYGCGSALFAHGIKVQIFFASSNLPEAYMDEQTHSPFHENTRTLRKPCEIDRSAKFTKNGIWTRLLHSLSWGWNEVIGHRFALRISCVDQECSATAAFHLSLELRRIDQRPVGESVAQQLLDQ